MLSAALSYMLYFPNSLANFCLLHTNCKNASSLRRQLKSTATQFLFFLREKFKNNKLFSAMLSIFFPGNHFVFIFSASLLKLKTWMLHCLRNWVNFLSEMYLLMSFMILFFFPYLHSQLRMNFHAMHHFSKSLHTRRNKNGKWYLLTENSLLKSPADAVGEQPSVCSAQQISLTLHRVAWRKEHISCC